MLCVFLKSTMKMLNYSYEEKTVDEMKEVNNYGLILLDKNINKHTLNKLSKKK